MPDKPSRNKPYNEYTFNEYTFKDYQNATNETAIYPKDKAIEYCILGLASEVGEICSKVKKLVRDQGIDLSDSDNIPLPVWNDLTRELGDVQWYLSELATALKCNLAIIAKDNIKKLQKRKKNNTLKGSGDNR